MGSLFFIFEALIGGIVSLLYSLLDRCIGDYINDIEEKAENKKLLIFSLITFAAILIIKLFLKIISSSNLCSAEISFNLFEKDISVVGMIDTGNLLKDPFDGTPVIIVKTDAVYKGENFEGLLERKYKNKIRLIPIKSIIGEKMLFGLKIKVKIKIKKEEERTCVIAFDNERGSFGGFYSLIPPELI
jgi:hypothetical protein